MKILIVTLLFFLSITLSAQDVPVNSQVSPGNNVTKKSTDSTLESTPAQAITPISKNPLVLLDGVQISNEQYKSANPGNYKSMMQLSSKAALEKYGEKGKYGAIIIITIPITEDSPIDYTDEAVFIKPEIMPEFPGGMNVMREWVSKHLVYPDLANKKRIEGTVFVRFIVNSRGEVANAEVVRSSDAIFDSEALLVVGLMPEWKPGLVKNKPVNVSFTMPIKFLFR